MSQFFASGGQSFGVLIEEDEGMSYSTILELCYVMHGESCMDVRVGLERKLSPEDLMLLNCAVGEDS